MLDFYCPLPFVILAVIQSYFAEIEWHLLLTDQDEMVIVELGYDRQCTSTAHNLHMRYFLKKIQGGGAQIQLVTDERSEDHWIGAYSMGDLYDLSSFLDLMDGCFAIRICRCRIIRSVQRSSMLSCQKR